MNKKDLYELDKILGFYYVWVNNHLEVFEQTRIHDKELRAHDYLRERFYSKKYKKLGKLKQN
tara:strand:+ start:40 stop:225 length:186 start_codon:yes stop_codon:yes gene_type:complete